MAARSPNDVAMIATLATQSGNRCQQIDHLDADMRPGDKRPDASNPLPASRAPSLAYLTTNAQLQHVASGLGVRVSDEQRIENVVLQRCRDLRQAKQVHGQFLAVA